MPRPVAKYFHERFANTQRRLDEAAKRPSTAMGAVERLKILEELLEDLLDLRAMLTAWTVENGMGEAPMAEVARRIGKSSPTVPRRYTDEHKQRLRSL